MFNIKKLAFTPVILIGCVGLAACSSSGSSSDPEPNNTNSSENTSNAGDTNAANGIDSTNGSENPNTTPSAPTSEPTSEPSEVMYLDAANINTELTPSVGDSGMSYELLGYRMRGTSTLAMDILATNKSDVIKSAGTCTGVIFKDEEFIALDDASFQGGTPIQPGDEIATTILFSSISDPNQADKTSVDCNFTDHVQQGTDPSITFDFLEITGPDDLGRIFPTVQLNNNSGETIKFARCDFNARNGIRILESTRIDFNTGGEIMPGEAYLGEGILILDFNEFESNSFNPADLHCDYDPAT